MDSIRRLCVPRGQMSPDLWKSGARSISPRRMRSITMSTEGSRVAILILVGSKGCSMRGLVPGVQRLALHPVAFSLSFFPDVGSPRGVIRLGHRALSADRL